MLLPNVVKDTGNQKIKPPYNRRSPNSSGGVLNNAALNILIHTYFKFFCGLNSFPGVYTEDIFLGICGYNYYATKGHWHSHQ